MTLVLPNTNQRPGGSGEVIKVLVGNLFESDAQTLVNTVNCVGVMGKGIALEFKKRYPDMFKDYVNRCNRGEVKLGRPYLYRSLVSQWVLNFPTKDHWRGVTKLQDVVEGLEFLLTHYKEWGITSIAVPPLGCGNGQLEWRVVGPTLYRYLRQMDIPVELYAPGGTPQDELNPGFLDSSSTKAQQLVPGAVPKISPAWVGLVEILNRMEDQPYRWPVGRVFFQKIAYVATEEGLPTGLVFQKGNFGPFSPDLKPMETKLVNNGVLIEEQLGRMLAVKVGPTYADAKKAYSAQLSAWEPIIRNVANLFMRTNTAQAELVATVMFSARQLGRDGSGVSEGDVFQSVMNWKPRLDASQVALTIRNLAALGRLKVTATKGLPIPKHEFMSP